MRKYCLILLVTFFLGNNGYAQEWESTYLPWKSTIKAFTIHDNSVWIVRGEELKEMTREGVLIEVHAFGSAINDVEVDYEGQLWVSTREYLYKLEAGEFIEVAPTVMSADILHDKLGRIWVKGLSDTIWFLEKGEDAFDYIKLNDFPQYSGTWLNESTRRYDFSTADDYFRFNILENGLLWGGQGKYEKWRLNQESLKIEIFHEYDSLFWGSVILDTNDFYLFSRTLDDDRIHINSLIFIGLDENYWVKEYPNQVHVIKAISRDTIRTIETNYQMENLVEDEDHELWGIDIGTNKIYYSSGNEFVEFIDGSEPESCLEDNSYGLVFNSGLLKDHLGNIWVQEGSRFVSENMTTELCNVNLSEFELPEEDETKYYYPEVFMDSKGFPWILEEDARPLYIFANSSEVRRFSIKKYDSKEWITEYESIPEENLYLRDVKMDKQDYFWIETTNNEILLFDGNNLRSITIYAENEVFDVDTSTNVWTIPKNIAFDLDVSGKVWITGAKGLLNFNGIDWEVFKGADFDYWDVVSDTEYGVIWLIEEYNGAILVEDLPLIDSPVSAANSPLSIRKTSIKRVKNGVSTTVLLPQEINEILSVVKDYRKGIWVTVPKRGVYYTADGITWIHYTMNNGLISNDIDDVEIDGQGNVWCLAKNLGWSKLSIGSVLGLSDESLEKAQVSFPNPVSSTLSITSDQTIARLDVYSLEGQKLLSSKSTQLDVVELKTGTYIVKVFTDDDYQSHLFIKE